MSRVHEYLGLIDNPSRPPLAVGHPADPVLHHLLVHLAFSDGVVQGDEFALLQRVRSGMDPGALMDWAIQLAEQPFVDSALSTLVDRGEHPMDLLRFAARMVCLDGDVADEERERLQQLAEVLELSPGAPGTVIGEIVARGGSVEPRRVREALRNMLWRVLVPRRDPPESAALLAAAPADEPVCTLMLGDREVAALYPDGLLAEFDAGPRFIAFDGISTYTRVPVPGAGFHLRTTDGVHHTVSDPGMADLGALLDYLFGLPR